MHTVGLEATTLILIRTRTTYQATGDAGLCTHDPEENNPWYLVHLASTSSTYM